MSHLSLIVYEDSTKVSMVADWTHRAQSVSFETGPHGFDNLIAFIPMTLEEAFRIYDGLAFAHLSLSNGAFVAFEGRIEDRPYTNGGLSVTAYGYQNALRDLPYTGMWSTTKLDDWVIITDEMNSAGSQTPEKYDLRIDELELYLTPRLDYTYTDAADNGSFAYRLPSRQGNDADFGGNDLAHIAFDYDIYLPTDWTVRTGNWDRGFTSGATKDTITADNTNQTGSKSITLDSSKRIVGILTRNDTGLDDQITGETGSRWVKIDNIRIKCTTSANVYADEIVKDLIAFVNGVNSTQLSSSTVLVDSPTVDLPDADYRDEYPAAILDQLAAIGDNSTPPVRYEWGVWEGQRLHFRQEYSEAQDWYIDVADLSLDSTIDEMYNSVYVGYTDIWGGRIQRTAVDDDAASQSKYGVVRRRMVRHDTTDSTLAGTVQDAALEDSADIRPRATIQVDRVFTASGARGELFQVRAGDNLYIRSLPPGSGGIIDNIRSMRIQRTNLDLGTGLLTITPGLPPSGLEFLVARNAVQNG